MRFMGLWHPAGPVHPPTQKDFENMGKLVDEMATAGVLVTMGGWDPRGPATILRRDKDKIAVIDGPFAEAKEAIGGFCVFEVASKAEALEWSRRFLAISGDGYSELREIPEGSYKR